MFDTIRLILIAFAALMFVLFRAARRFPEVAWLQPFRNALPRLDEAQRARMRRRANVYAGAELILLGICLPLGYGLLTMMFFSEFTTTAVTLVLGSSVLCIVLGITAIVTSRRS